LSSKVVRELPEMQYQLQKPFIVDSSRMQCEFGLSPTPLTDILQDGLLGSSGPIATLGGINS